MKNAFTFDEVSHSYTLDGAKIPSVTQVLSDVRLIDLSMVPQRYLAAACEFGGIVHKATEFSDLESLDEKSIDEEVTAHLNAWKKFRNEHQVNIFEIEKRVFSKKHKFAGTLDRVGMIDGRLCIIDIKTGSKQKAYSCQTGAYALAYNEMTGEKIKDRYCVYLDENEYRLEHHTEKLDEMIFLSALSVYQYKYKRRP